MKGRRRTTDAPRARGDEVVRDTFLRSCAAAAVAFAVGVIARLAGLDTRSAATALLSAAFVGSAYTCYRVLETRFRKRRAGALACGVVIAAAVPVTATLWPGASLLSGTLSGPMEEIGASALDERAVWVLVASNVGHDREWWGEYELRLNDVMVGGHLGYLRAKGWQRDRFRLRPPDTEVRARYHRVHLAEPLHVVRLERMAGHVPGGLDVSAMREPLLGRLSLIAWLIGALVVTAGDVGWRFKGVLGLAAAVPFVVSALTWRDVTPAAPLEVAFRAVIAGTLVGAFAGYGTARLASFGLRHPFISRRT